MLPAHEPKARSTTPGSTPPSVAGRLDSDGLGRLGSTAARARASGGRQVSSNGPGPQEGRGKRVVGALAAGLVLGLTPFALTSLGLGPPPQPVAWVTIFFAFFLVCMKVSAAKKVSSDGFTFAKQGHDFCQMAISSSITAFAVQSTTDQDILPGARRLLTDIHMGPPLNEQSQNIVGLFVLALLAGAGFLISAKLIDEIRQDRAAKDAPPKAAVCYLLGVASIAANTLVLISK